MFVLTAKISKKKLLIILLLLTALLLPAVFLLLRSTGQQPAATVATNQERISYLASWGWAVEPEPLETLQLIFPQQLPSRYAAYNELQKSQGFDLEDCCGKQVTRYTYTVTNYPGRPEQVQVNLYICEGQPVAGDLIAAGDKGFQAGLEFPKSEKAG
jgi:hypothetical protein